MSWAEVIKINSDFANEPLNFCNYINDISTFKQNSYVMDTQNSSLWRQLITQSLTMFGHNGIHSCVYERFTDDDVDYMLSKNARLGQSFNSFYKTNVYTKGDMDAVLGKITSSTYNKLERKFQTGINRYIESKLTKDSAGAWLDKVFGMDVFTKYTSIQEILSSTELWSNTILPNESLRVVICNCASAIAYVANENTSIFQAFVATVATSTDATMDLINQLNGNSKLTSFFADATVCSSIANNKASMTAIIYHTAGFSAMIASATAMQKVANSTVAMNVIIEGITNACNSETVLGNIKNNLSNIEKALPSIANTSTVISQVKDTKTTISGCVTELQKVNSKTDVLINNVGALVNNATAMDKIASSQTAMDKIASSQTTMNKIISSQTAIKSVANAQMWVDFISKSETYALVCAFNKIAYTAMMNGKYGDLFSTNLYNILISSSKTSSKSDMYSDKNNNTLSGAAKGSTSNYILNKFEENKIILVDSIYSWDASPNDSNGTNTVTLKSCNASIVNYKLSSQSVGVKKAFVDLNMEVYGELSSTYPGDMRFSLGYRTYTK